MNVRYQVELNQAERSELVALLSGGKHAARKLKRAQILLAADAGASDENIATSVGVGGSTVYRTKRRFVEGNLEAALTEEPRPGAARKLLGKEEALLVATACSNPPEGRTRWTLDLLAGAMVKLTEHDSISRETVRQRLACMRELTDVHFPAAGADPGRARQSIDALGRRAVPSNPRVRSATCAASIGVPLCAQARQLAEHGRGRDRCAAWSMPRQAHCHPAAARI